MAIKKKGPKKSKGNSNSSLETHINKGLTKHQAVNAVCGAGTVKAPAPK